MNGPDIHSVVERKRDPADMVARQKLATFFVGQLTNYDWITVCHGKCRPDHRVEVGEHKSVGMSADARKDVGVSRLLSRSLGAIASQEFRSFPTVSIVLVQQFVFNRRSVRPASTHTMMRMLSWP